MHKARQNMDINNTTKPSVPHRFYFKFLNKNVNMQHSSPSNARRDSSFNDHTCISEMEKKAPAKEVSKCYLGSSILMVSNTFYQISLTKTTCVSIIDSRHSLKNLHFLYVFS